jgi:hypothetical protein
MRNLIHDIGLKLKTYAICVQTRRIKDGFADTTNSLTHPDWDFKMIYDNTLQMTKMAKSYIREHDRTMLVGKSREHDRGVIQEALKSSNQKQTEYSIRNLHL